MHIVYNAPPRCKLLNHSGLPSHIYAVYIASVFLSYLMLSLNITTHRLQSQLHNIIVSWCVDPKKKRNRDTLKCTIYDEFTYIYYSSPAFHSTFPHFSSLHYLLTHLSIYIYVLHTTRNPLASVYPRKYTLKRMAGRYV